MNSEPIIPKSQVPVDLGMPPDTQATPPKVGTLSGHKTAHPSSINTGLQQKTQAMAKERLSADPQFKKLTDIEQKLMIDHMAKCLQAGTSITTPESRIIQDLATFTSQSEIKALSPAMQRKAIFEQVQFLTQTAATQALPQTNNQLLDLVNRYRAETPPPNSAKHQKTAALLQTLKSTDPQIQQQAREIAQHVHNTVAKIRIQDVTPKGVNPPDNRPNSFTAAAQIENQLTRGVVSDILNCKSKKEASKKFAYYVQLAGALANEGELTAALAIYGALEKPNVQTLFFPQGTREDKKLPLLLKSLKSSERKAYLTLKTLMETRENANALRQATEILHTTLPVQLAGKDITAAGENVNPTVNRDFRARIYAHTIPAEERTGSPLSPTSAALFSATATEDQLDVMNAKHRKEWFKSLSK